MKKIVELNETQFRNLIDRVINESPEGLKLQHWKEKFHQSIDFLISNGYKPGDLKKEIDKFSLIKGADVSNFGDPVEYQKEVRRDRNIEV